MIMDIIMDSNEEKKCKCSKIKYLTISDILYHFFIKKIWNKPHIV